MLNIKSIEIFSEKPGAPSVRNQIGPEGEKAPSFKEVFERAQSHERRADPSACDRRSEKSEEAHGSADTKQEPVKGRADTKQEPAASCTNSDSARDGEPVKGREESKESEDRLVEELPPSNVSTLVPPIVPDNSVQLKPLVYIADSKKLDSSSQAENFKVQVENNGISETTNVAPLPPASIEGLEAPSNAMSTESPEELSPSTNEAPVRNGGATVSDKTASSADSSSPAEALEGAYDAGNAKVLAADKAPVDTAVNAASPFGKPSVPPHAQHQVQAHEKKFSLEIENNVSRDKSLEGSALFQSERSPKAGETMGEQPTMLLKSTEVEFHNQSGGADVNARQENFHHRDMNKASSDQVLDFKSSIPQGTSIEQHNGPSKANTGFGSAAQDLPAGFGAAHKPAAEFSIREVSPTSLNEAKSPVVSSSNPSETAETRSGNLSRAEQFDLVHEMVQKMKVMLRNGDSEVKITLKPEYLGELHLRATIRENGVIASILTQSAEVKDYLESHLYLLQNALQEQGLRLDKLEITTGGNLSADLSGGNASSSNRDHPRSVSPKAAFSLDVHQDDPLPEPADIAYIDAPIGRVNLTV